jgi:flagellar assembly factor FliW
MLIETTRFGPLEIEDDRVIHFAGGVLGFPDHHRYALIQTATDPVFFWLQSLDEPALAFVVCDPTAFVPDYRAPIRADDVAALGMEGLGDCQILVIVNKVDDQLTANLIGPLVIGAQSLLGKQLVLADKRYSTRHPLLQVQAAREMAKTA